MSDAAIVRLAEEARQRPAPAMRPADAATLIVLDRSGREPRMLMGRRHPSHRFMPGKFVFPGGRIEASDRAMPVAGALAGICETRLMARVQRPNPLKARALALAAIRETFEETGLLFGRTDYGAPENPPEGVWRDFAAHGVFPDLEPVTFVARAITPPGRTRRFDTRFFTIDHRAAAHQVADVVNDDTELDQLVWVTFDEARRLDLPRVTYVVLDELRARIAAGFAPHHPVPFYAERHRRWVRETL